MIRSFIKHVLRRAGLEVHRIPPGRYLSETSKCRHRLAMFCIGCGIDIGPGGDPITPAAVRVDLPTPYANVGGLPVQLSGSATDLRWFRDNVLDYVYSSHVLEDVVDTGRVLQEWLRVLRPGGHLVLFCPDEQVYRAVCRRTGQQYNEHHVHENFSLAFVKGILEAIGVYAVIHECALVDDYSWELVITK